MVGDYKSALRAGQRAYRARIARGQSPYLAVLDDVLKGVDIVAQEPLGLVEIPSDSLVGTKTSGRHTAFSYDFMPLLEPDTEFAAKWSNLCDAHLEEGIHTPIIAFEYMNRFYVQEGNKRVSVLKYYGAVKIPGTVTRLIPARTEDLENKIYYEFLDFYKLSKVNYVHFSKLGGYSKLQTLVCKASGEAWSEDDRLNFAAFYTMFHQQFEALGGRSLGLTTGDALLVYLSVYRYSDTYDATPAQVRQNLEKLWNEVKVLTEPHGVELSLEPPKSPAEPLLSKLNIFSPSKQPSELRVVFLHEYNAKISAWVRAHDEGRDALAKVFPDKVYISCYEDVNPEVDAKRISRADGCRRAIEAPRGHAKSTTFTFKDDLHAAVYGYKHYIIILSDSSEQAEGFLVDIKTELEENAALKEDFGELEGKVWKSSVILLANGVKIEAIGSGKKIRGRRHKQWRPDLIVCDDLENDENVNTPEQRKKLRDWFYKAVSKAGDTYTDIVYIGTLLHFDALLANVAKNPSYKSVRYQGVISFATNGELWDAWESIFTDLSNDNRQEDALEFFQANREAMLEGTAVLWEEKLSYYDLMVIRISEGEASFNSEIQNDPIDPENCTFQEEWFDFWDDEGKAQPDFSDPKFLFIGANDPSLGKNKKSDTSSIIALAKDTQTGYLYVVIADIAKRKPDQIIEDALDASRRLQREYKRPYYKFGVETVQFQYYFAEIMRQRAAAVGEYLPIEEINSTQNKDARIQSLQPFVKNGYIKFSKKHKTLLKQMTEYPMGKNDDAPDGLQMAVKLALDVKIGRRVDYRSVIARALDFRRGAY